MTVETNRDITYNPFQYKERDYMKFSRMIAGTVFSVMLSGCAAVQYNDGEKVSIQSDGWYGLEMRALDL